LKMLEADCLKRPQAVYAIYFLFHV